jgi:hypothetical protein
MSARIVTHFVHPSIPDRNFDWSAVRDGYEPGDLVGWGRTEQAAIGDLIDLEAQEYEPEVEL